MLRYVTKHGNKDVKQGMLDNLYDMLVTEFLTHKKDKQVALVNAEMNKKLVQIINFETYDEEYV